MGIIYSRCVLRPTRTVIAYTLSAISIAALIKLAFHLDGKHRDTERELNALHWSLSRKNTGISGQNLSKSKMSSSFYSSGTDSCETITSSEYDDNIYRPLAEFKADRILERMIDSMNVIGDISIEKDGLLSFTNFCKVYRLIKKYGHVSLYPQIQ